MKCVWICLALFTPLFAPIATAQDAADTELVDSLKENNALLKKQLATLEEKVATLEQENERLTDELREARKSKGKKVAGEADDEKEDQLPIGSTWSGTLDGRNPTGEFHDAVTATITARDEDSFQIRTRHGEVEWLYNCETYKKGFRVVKAELLAAPAGFGTAVGVVRINSSEVTTPVKNGKQYLKIVVVRPVKNSGVNATFVLARD